MNTLELESLAERLADRLRPILDKTLDREIKDALLDAAAKALPEVTKNGAIATLTDAMLRNTARQSFLAGFHACRDGRFLTETAAIEEFVRTYKSGLDPSQRAP